MGVSITIGPSNTPLDTALNNWLATTPAGIAKTEIESELAALNPSGDVKHTREYQILIARLAKAEASIEETKAALIQVAVLQTMSFANVADDSDYSVG